MTTMTTPRHSQDVGARQLTVDLLQSRGAEGVPLIEVLEDLVVGGQQLSAVTAAITEMLQAGEVDLTGERRLRLAGSDQ